MSKFGLLGDIDTQLAQVRRDVSHAAGTINNVRRALTDAELTPELVARLAALLQEAEGKLDNLIQR